ncbi:hypothetical protein [Clostridium botulinum]|uniref:hypothetical protein n=1 Tax=Clostridium botulinum TaxID=1491 RepID=UPI001E4EC504|nr:hypothetical protein [Clostridium botulinum]MCD3223947.1 hypothetical protein [Clostridium botulinum C/D]
MNILKKLKDKISLIGIEDILIFIGLFFIVLATFSINLIAGFYVLGSSFLTMGIVLLKFPIRR